MKKDLRVCIRSPGGEEIHENHVFDCEPDRLGFMLRVQVETELRLCPQDITLESDNPDITFKVVDAWPTGNGYLVEAIVYEALKSSQARLVNEWRSRSYLDETTAPGKMHCPPILHATSLHDPVHLPTGELVVPQNPMLTVFHVSDELVGVNSECSFVLLVKMFGELTHEGESIGEMIVKQMPGLVRDAIRNSREEPDTIVNRLQDAFDQMQEACKKYEKQGACVCLMILSNLELILAHVGNIVPCFYLRNGGVSCMDDDAQAEDMKRLAKDFPYPFSRCLGMSSLQGPDRFLSEPIIERFDIDFENEVAVVAMTGMEKASEPVFTALGEAIQKLRASEQEGINQLAALRRDPSVTTFASTQEYFTWRGMAVEPLMKDMDVKIWDAFASAIQQSASTLSKEEKGRQQALYGSVWQKIHAADRLHSFYDDAGLACMIVSDLWMNRDA